jgi:hypothetical protein
VLEQNLVAYVLVEQLPGFVATDHGSASPRRAG